MSDGNLVTQVAAERTSARSAAPLLEVNGVSVTFQRSRRAEPFRALDDVSLSVARGETVAVVGESGSGKTTLALSVLGLVSVAAGAIRFAGRDITNLPMRKRRDLTRAMQVVFQDPYSSINPARTVEQTLVEPLLVHERLSREMRRTRVSEMLERVGLPAGSAQKYPSEFSGGQRQRISIARALIVAPQLVLCDEAVSALDLSVQAQILNLLIDLREALGIAYLFISHDLAVVRHLASSVVVLYRGQVMEAGPTLAVTEHAAHPYTQALLAAAPSHDPRRAKQPNRARPVADVRTGLATGGCPYQSRCPFVMDVCKSQRPEPRPTSSGTFAACHLVANSSPPARGETERTKPESDSHRKQ